MQVIQLSCPGCKKKLKIKGELAGKKIKCTCGQKLLVPEAAAITAKSNDDFELPFEAEQTDWKEIKPMVEETPVVSKPKPDKIEEPTQIIAKSTFRIKWVIVGLLIVLSVVGCAVGIFFLIQDRSEKQAVAAKLEVVNNSKAEYDKAIKFYDAGAYLNAIQVMDNLIAKDSDNLEYRRLRRGLYVAAKNHVLAKEEAAYILSTGKSDKDNDLVLCKMCVETNDAMLYQHFSRLLEKYKVDQIGRPEIQEFICHIISRKNSTAVSLYFDLYLGALYSDLTKSKFIDPSSLVKINAAAEQTLENTYKIAGMKAEIDTMEQQRKVFEFKIKFGTFIEQENAKSNLKSMEDEIAFKKKLIGTLTKSVNDVEALRKAAEEANNARN